MNESSSHMFQKALDVLRAQSAEFTIASNAPKSFLTDDFNGTVIFQDHVFLVPAIPILITQEMPHHEVAALLDPFFERVQGVLFSSSEFQGLERVASQGFSSHGMKEFNAARFQYRKQVGMDRRTTAFEIIDDAFVVEADSRLTEVTPKPQGVSGRVFVGQHNAKPLFANLTIHLAPSELFVQQMIRENDNIISIDCAPRRVDMIPRAAAAEVPRRETSESLAAMAA